MCLSLLLTGVENSLVVEGKGLWLWGDGFKTTFLENIVGEFV